MSRDEEGNTRSDLRARIIDKFKKDWEDRDQKLREQFSDLNFDKAVKYAEDYFRRKAEFWENTPFDFDASPTVLGALRTGEDVTEFLDLTKESTWAFDGVKKALTEHLLKDGEIHQPAVKIWLARYLAGDIVGPRNEAHRPRGQNDFRNWVIRETLRDLVEIGRMQPTKGDNRKKVSACEAVAKAHGIGYDTVRKLWAEHQAEKRSQNG